MKPKSLKYFFWKSFLKPDKEIFLQNLFPLKYSFGNPLAIKYFIKSCVTRSSQELGNLKTRWFHCFCVGAASTLISVPDLETM